MSYIQSFNRKQAVLIAETKEQLIAENNPVRFIDVFVHSQDIVAFGFKDIGLTKNGRPPFGTMKRPWGFDHSMTKKSMKRASATVGFIIIAYNLKRIMNIIGIEKLITLIDSFSLIFWVKKEVTRIINPFYYSFRMKINFFLI